MPRPRNNLLPQARVQGDDNRIRRLLRFVRVASLQILAMTKRIRR